ncbi:MAG: ribosome silencing factor [Candidatus Zixiibacteriota bacterium]
MKITPRRLARLAGQFALEKKALDVKILDLRKLSSVCDFFVICSASVDVQAKAIADWITENLRQRGINYWHSEGYQACRWILLDYVDVVVHIFLPQVREFYGLESLWGDAKMEEVTEETIAAKRSKAKAPGSSER